MAHFLLARCHRCQVLFSVTSRRGTVKKPLWSLLSLALHYLLRIKSGVSFFQAG